MFILQLFYFYKETQNDMISTLIIFLCSEGAFFYWTIFTKYITPNTTILRATILHATPNLS